MFEPEGTPVLLGLSAEEWEASIFGFKDGLRFWKRQHLKYSDIDALDISPSLKKSIKEEYHYYQFFSDLPEDLVLLTLLAYLIYTGQAESLIKMALAFFGVAL